MLYGDDPESPLELTNIFPGYDPLRTGNARVEELSVQLAQRRRWALQVWEAGEKADSLRYDRTHHAFDYKPGDIVWLDTRQIPVRASAPDHSPKLRPKFTGPFTVVEVKSANVVSVRLIIDGRSRGLPLVVSTKRLKKQETEACGTEPVVVV